MLIATGVNGPRISLVEQIPTNQISANRSDPLHPWSVTLVSITLPKNQFVDGQAQRYYAYTQQRLLRIVPRYQDQQYNHKT